MMTSIKNKINICVSLHLDADLYKQTNQRVYLNLTGTLDDNLHNQLCLDLHNKLFFNIDHYDDLNKE
jgi:hypothetical protein